MSILFAIYVIGAVFVFIYGYRKEAHRINNRWFFGIVVLFYPLAVPAIMLWYMKYFINYSLEGGNMDAPYSPGNKAMSDYTEFDRKYRKEKKALERKLRKQNGKSNRSH